MHRAVPSKFLYVRLLQPGILFNQQYSTLLVRAQTHVMRKFMTMVS